MLEQKGSRAAGEGRGRGVREERASGVLGLISILIVSLATAASLSILLVEIALNSCACDDNGVWNPMNLHTYRPIVSRVSPV